MIPPPVRLLGLAALAIGAIACGGDASDPAGRADRARSGGPATPDGAVAAAAVKSGADLYTEHCALCHGADGDGEPQIPLAVKPRSFAEGGFAFGNTRESLFRVVTDGMPGSDFMKPYRDILTEEERWRVVDHVRGLMPQAQGASASERVLTVGERAVVVRGHLPPLAEGLPLHPRGLVVGLPGGISLEYRSDDLRLLAVRTGGFVDRRDWDGRGGSPLQPLGDPARMVAGGDPPPPFAAAEGAPLAADLVATSVDGQTASIEYDLDRDGDTIARVVERLSPAAQSKGFSREIRIRAVASVPALVVRLDEATPDERLLEREGDPASGGRAVIAGGDRELALDVIGPPGSLWTRDEGTVALRLPALDASQEVVVTVRGALRGPAPDGGDPDSAATEPNAREAGTNGTPAGGDGEGSR